MLRILCTIFVPNQTRSNTLFPPIPYPPSLSTNQFNSSHELQFHHIFIPSSTRITRSDLINVPKKTQMEQSVPVRPIGRSSGSIYPCAIRARMARALILVRALDRGAVVLVRARADFAAHAVGVAEFRVRGHACKILTSDCLVVWIWKELTIVCAVETQVGDPVIPFNASGLLQTGGKVVRHLTEDGNLALDEFGVAACRHVT